MHIDLLLLALSATMRFSLRVAKKSTQNLITRVPESTAVDVHNAVTSADSAQKLWRRLPLSKRRKHLLRLIELIRSHEVDLVSRTLGR